MLTTKNKRTRHGTSDYVCVACGTSFLTPTQRAQRARQGLIVTMQRGKCDVCHKIKTVTHIRAFNYLQKPRKRG